VKQSPRFLAYETQAVQTAKQYTKKPKAGNAAHPLVVAAPSQSLRTVSKRIRLDDEAQGASGSQQPPTGKILIINRIC
jgi:hypothetical protein